jgi:hypothetical protein
MNTANKPSTKTTLASMPRAKRVTVVADTGPYSSLEMFARTLNDLPVVMGKGSLEVVAVGKVPGKVQPQGRLIAVSTTLAGAAGLAGFAQGWIACFTREG